jgi:hypothetical protein
VLLPGGGSVNFFPPQRIVRGVVLYAARVLSKERKFFPELFSLNASTTDENLCRPHSNSLICAKCSCFLHLSRYQGTYSEQCLTENEFLEIYFQFVSSCYQL